MKCYLIRPALGATARKPVNGHSTDCNTLGKDNTEVVGPPPTSSTPSSGGADAMDMQHVLLYVRCYPRQINLGTTYPHPLTLPKLHSFPHCMSCLSLLTPLPQMKLGVQTKLLLAFYLCIKYISHLNSLLSDRIILILNLFCVDILLLFTSNFQFDLYFRLISQGVYSRHEVENYVQVISPQGGREGGRYQQYQKLIHKFQQ